MTTIVSCNKLEESLVGDMTSVAPEDAIKEFSIILSKAASNDHKLRLFMKEEVEKPCARDPRSPVPLTLAVQNSLSL